MSHQAAVTPPDKFLTQLDALKTKVFAHRTDSLTKISEYRTRLSQDLEKYYDTTLNLIDTNVRLYADADLPFLAVLGNEFPGDCVTGIKQQLDYNIEIAGYGVSVCVSDSDGIAVDAYKSAATALDGFERTFNQEPTLLTNTWIGRNIYTEGKALVTRATNQANARVTTYENNLAAVAKSLDDTAAVYQAQIAQMTACFKARQDVVESQILRISKTLPTCQVFSSG